MVLDELRSQGYATGDDAARSIIRERKRAGLSPRPEPLAFAQQVFEKEAKAYHSVASSPSYFERGIVEAVASLFGAGALDEERVEQLLRDHPYQAVFIFPPWQDIYRMDDERDHTFDHSVRVYESTLGFYRRHDYEPIKVPKGSVGDRVQFILDHVDVA